MALLKLMLGLERCLAVHTSIYLPCPTAHRFSPPSIVFIVSFEMCEEGGQESGTFVLLKNRLCSAFGDFINENQLNHQRWGVGTVALAVTSASGTKPKLALTTKSYSES